MAKRRANGEGSVRQRGESSWEIRLYDKNHPDPKKRRKSVYAKSYEEALIELKKMQYQLKCETPYFLSSFS